MGTDKITRIVKLPPEGKSTDTSVKLKDVLRPLKKEQQNLILDFSDVDIIMSVSMQQLLIINNLLQANCCALVLCCLKEVSRSIFTVMGVEHAFTFAKGVQEADGLITGFIVSELDACDDPRATARGMGKN